jgi:putative FmdB family regulatory protein
VPTYQYACTECGHSFEQFQSFHDDALTHCPECEGRLRKVFNAVGVVFKGSGFYRTDSRSGSTASVPAASGSTSTTSGSSSSGSSSSEGGSSSGGSSSEGGSSSGSGTPSSSTAAAS